MLRLRWLLVPNVLILVRPCHDAKAAGRSNNSAMKYGRLAKTAKPLLHDVINLLILTGTLHSEKHQLESGEIPLVFLPLIRLSPCSGSGGVAAAVRLLSNH